MLFCKLKNRLEGGESVGCSMEFYTDNGTETLLSPHPYVGQKFAGWLSHRGKLHDSFRTHLNLVIYTPAGFWETYHEVEAFAKQGKYPLRVLEEG